MAGNVSLTWMYRPDDPASHDRVRTLFDEQLHVQVEEGVDFVIGETFSFLGEALLAAERGKATGLPTMVTMCFENEDVSAEGDTPAECAGALVDAGADVVGVNCLRNPDATLPLVAAMREAVDVPIAAQPTAYRTPPGRPDFTGLEEFPTGLDPLQMTRHEMAD